MKTELTTHKIVYNIMNRQALSDIKNNIHSRIALKSNKQRTNLENRNNLAEILFITSYPPRECGVATYSQDLIKALNNKFSNSLSIKVCALESGDANYQYSGVVKYILNTSLADEYVKLASTINKDNHINCFDTT
jgi:hypothetical protein